MYLLDRYLYALPLYETTGLIPLPKSFPEWKYTESDSFYNRHKPDFLPNYYCEILDKFSRSSRPQVPQQEEKKWKEGIL